MNQFLKISFPQQELINPWKTKSIWSSSNHSGKSNEVVKGKYIHLNLTKGEEIVLADCEKALNYVDHIKLQKGKESQARKMTFEDDMVVWLGKPKQSIYYRALENSCFDNIHRKQE